MIRGRQREWSLCNVEMPNCSVEDNTYGEGPGPKAHMALYRTSNYSERYPPGEVRLPVGSILYVGVHVESIDPEFVAVLDNCYATRSNRSDDPERHFLIRNKCPVNKREVRLIESGTSLYARFYALLYLIDGEYRDIYLHCSLHLCDPMASSCAVDCYGRRRRSTSSAVAVNPVSVGPIIWVNAGE